MTDRAPLRSWLLVGRAYVAALLVFLSCFPLCTATEGESPAILSSDVRPVEKKLRKYLNKRLLVFREGEIGREQTKFNFQGYRVAESRGKLQSNQNAILFTDLRFDTEQLMIVGEAVQVAMERGDQFSSAISKVETSHLHSPPGRSAG
jgi:hypothetical protein